MLTAQIHSLTGGTKKSRELYLKGLKKAIETINSEEFKEAVRNYEWINGNGIKQKNFKLNVLSSGQQLSRGELHTLLMSGWDKYDQNHDGDVDIQATLFYKRWSSAIGYTYPSTRGTWINTKFWTGTEEQKVARIASNITHEYMHNMGFTHAYNNNPTRKHTVPYAIGTIVYNIITETETDLQADRVYVCKRTWYTFFIGKKCKWIRK